MFRSASPIELDCTLIQTNIFLPYHSERREKAKENAKEEEEVVVEKRREKKKPYK